jgi:Cytochrome oxidase complex assembly protein 1
MADPDNSGWWERNWRFVVDAGAVATIVAFLAGAYATYTGWLTLPGFTHSVAKSEAYELALAQARAHPSVIRSLGTPIQDEATPTGQLSSDAARYYIQLSGSGGTGSLEAEADRTDGRWMLTKLIFRSYPECLPENLLGTFFEDLKQRPPK